MVDIDTEKSVYLTVDEAVKEVRRGRMVILVDDEDRENEGDLVFSASLVTPELVNFMAKNARGLICLALDGKQCDRLDLPLMVTGDDNKSQYGTAFTLSIEASLGITTGISVQDRATTIEVAAHPQAKACDVVSPGHIFPLRARDGGVLVRAGQTEGSVDLMRIAGLPPAGVICEIMNEDGAMARLPELEVYAKRHNIGILSVADIIEYRLKTEKVVTVEGSALLPTDYGKFKVLGFKSVFDDQEGVALVKGEPDGLKPVLVRIHSQCLTGDVFCSRRCDCGDQLDVAMKMIENEGVGVIVYLFQEGRGIGILNKIKAYHLQDKGLDTAEANVDLGFEEDMRDYGFGASILKYLSLEKIRIITNNPKKMKCLSGYGLDIVERIATNASINDDNRKYLQTKKEKFGHRIDI